MTFVCWYYFKDKLRCQRHFVLVLITVLCNLTFSSFLLISWLQCVYCWCQKAFQLFRLHYKHNLLVPFLHSNSKQTTPTVGFEPRTFWLLVRDLSHSTTVAPLNISSTVCTFNEFHGVLIFDLEETVPSHCQDAESTLVSKIWCEIKLLCTLAERWKEHQWPWN
jgi:hypothetical protein